MRYFCHLGIFGQLSPMAWLVSVLPWVFRVGVFMRDGEWLPHLPVFPPRPAGAIHPWWRPRALVPTRILPLPPHPSGLPCRPARFLPLWGVGCPALSRCSHAHGKVWLAPNSQHSPPYAEFFSGIHNPPPPPRLHKPQATCAPGLMGVHWGSSNRGTC